MNTDNWQIGKKGFQPKLSQKQQLGLVEVWIQNDWETQPAKKWLKEEHRIELRQNTLWYYKKRLKERWDRANSDLDNPADWGDFLTLTKNGVPPEHRRELHRMWRDNETAFKRLGASAIKPTYRRLHWWAYIIEYYGDVIEGAGDRQYVAEMYVARQMARDLFDIPMETKDLDEWLSYQPWEGGDKEAAYLQAIADGLIPPIADLGQTIGDIERAENTALGAGSTPADALRVVTDGWRWGTRDPGQIPVTKPYLLPSQDDFIDALNRHPELAKHMVRKPEDGERT